MKIPCAHKHTKIKEPGSDDCRDCLLILLLTRLYYGVPGFPLLQRQLRKDAGGSGTEQKESEQGGSTGTANVRLKEGEEEEKERLS